MKKNKMMRLASVMLVLTMMTTCAISGTFAKYTSAADATDSARVAKWGVAVNASGTLFGANYEAEGSGNEIAAEVKYSVDSSDTTNVVAPGTQNSTGMTFAVIGKPEVANTVTFTKVNSAKFEDIYLAPGHYAILVKATGVNADNVTKYYVASGENFVPATSFSNSENYYALCDKATVTGDKYYPIVWKIDGSNAAAKTTAALYEEFVLAYADIVNGSVTGDTVPADNINQANIDIAATHTITWVWPFDGVNNGADTILGNLMAAGGSVATDNNYIVVESENDTYATCTKLVEDTDYNLNVYFDAQLTVTQVD